MKIESSSSPLSSSSSSSPPSSSSSSDVTADCDNCNERMRVADIYSQINHHHHHYHHLHHHHHHRNTSSAGNGNSQLEINLKIPATMDDHLHDNPWEVSNLDSTISKQERVDDCTPFTSGQPFLNGSSVDESRHRFPSKRNQLKKKKLRGNKTPINNSIASEQVNLESVEHVSFQQDLPDGKPSTFLSSSFPSSGLLCLSSLKGNALSLPPSPLFLPSDSPATSASLSSLHERRKSKQGQKTLSPLSLFDYHNGPSLDCSPGLEGSTTSKYDPLTQVVRDDANQKSTPTNSAGQFPIKVLNGLYLGNAQTSADLRCLQDHNIRYIVNVTSDVLNSFEGISGFEYLRIPIADDSWSQNMDKYFQSAINFIDEGRRKNHSTLIHCMAGVSRSVTVTMAYLMKSENLGLDEAYELLRSCKSNINPNLSLMGQLEIFGEKLKKERLKTPPPKQQQQYHQQPQHQQPQQYHQQHHHQPQQQQHHQPQQQHQQHLLAMSSLTINQAATKGNILTIDQSPSSSSSFCQNIHSFNSSALITPETATFSDIKSANPVFEFPCTPPSTPSSRDCFVVLQNRAMSLPNGSEFEEL